MGGDIFLKSLFPGAIDSSYDAMVRAAEAADAHEFVDAMPQKYDSIIARRGADLSGGQRQMLTIAWAMVADPHMLILDETTSNVDTRTEKLIQEGLLKLQEGKTSFIIATDYQPYKTLTRYS